jgi:glycosyltransferase involved in cell wall biosynthesis
VRIAHSHSARSRGEDYSWAARLFRLAAIPLIARVATRRIGISEDALIEIAGRRWRRAGNASILFYGFDFSRFAQAGARAAALRADLALPAEARIVGNVGRFFPVKNHRLLLHAFAICRHHCPEAQLVMVGAGPLRPELQATVSSLALSDAVHFAGTSDDVPAFMALFDLFVLPSFSEGLGIVCVEAQAAGTPLLVSNTIPAEALVVDGAAETLDPGAEARDWGSAMARLLKRPAPTAPPGDWLHQVARGRFGLDRCLAELGALYRVKPSDPESAMARNRP